MFRAWTPRRTQRSKLGQRTVKVEAPRCQLSLERCEERLPPGQLVDFFFDPVGDVLPLFLNASQREHIRNTPALQADLPVSLLDSWTTPEDAATPLGLDQLGSTSRGTPLIVSGDSTDETVLVWMDTTLASGELFADLLASPFTTDDAAVADQADAAAADEAALHASVAAMGGARLVNPSDLAVNAGQQATTPAVGTDLSAAAQTLLVYAGGSLVDDSVTLTGTLQVLDAFQEGGGGHEHFYELTTEDGRTVNLLTDEDMHDLETGSVLSVRGVQTAEGLLTSRDQITVLEAPPPQEEDGAPADPGASGPGAITYRTVLVININFSDRIQTPWTIASVETLFDGAIANWYLQSSYYRMTTYTDAAGWYTIPSTSTACNSGTWNTQAQAAANAQGYAVSSYNHVVIAFPRVPACNWSGLGQVPGRITWLNQAMNHGVAVHELGHNLGLAHSHSRRCTSGPLLGSCTVSEYGDPFDAMGNAGGRGPHHGSYRSHVGWLPAADRVNVTPAMGEAYVGIYSATNSFGSRIIQVRRGNGRSDSLYLEWREAAFADSVLSGQTHMLNGVTIYLGTTLRDQSLVDVNYTTTTASDSALQIGQVLWDYEGDVAIWPYERSDQVTWFYIVYGLS